MKSQPLDPGQRPLHGGTMELQSLGEFGKGGLGYIAAALRNDSDQVWLRGQATIGLERVDCLELAGGGCDGSLEVGRLGVDDSIEVSADRSRDLARFEFK
jgi:hypothetical protein